MATDNSTPLTSSAAPSNAQDAQTYFATVLQTADQIDALLTAADNDDIGEHDTNVLLDVVASLGRSLESAGYESPVNIDDLDISSLCWQLQYFAELVRNGDKKHLPSYRDTVSLMTDKLREIANANANTTKRETAILLSVSRTDDGFEYAITTAPEIQAQEAADALFSVTLDVKAKADAGLPRAEIVASVPARGAAAKIDEDEQESAGKALDLDDLRRRCDEIHFLLCSFCGTNSGNAKIGIGERAYLKALKDAASALESVVSDVDELCMYASRVKTFAGLALDAGGAEHDIPELEAIGVELLNHIREEAGLPTRTTGDAACLAGQIAKDQAEAA